MRLGARAWPDLDLDAPSLLVIPLGATEQHGPHPPLETHTLSACARSRTVAAGRDDEQGVRAVSASGVLGDARGATDTEGRELLRDLSADFTAVVDAARSTSCPA